MCRQAHKPCRSPEELSCLPCLKGLVMANTTRLSPHGADECHQTEDLSYLVPHRIPIWKELAHHTQKSLFIFIFSKYGKLSPKDLRTLTLYLPYKGRAYAHGILISSVPLYKHENFSSPRFVKFPNSYTFRVIRDHFNNNLTFRGSLAGILLVFFVSSSPFILQVPPITARVDNQLIDDFVHHQLEFVDRIDCDLLLKVY